MFICYAAAGNVQRVRFVAGQRAFNLLGACIARQNTLNLALCVPPAGHAAAVERLQNERKATNKEMKACNEELAVLLGRSIWHEATATTAEAGTPVLIAIHRPGASLAFLQQVAETILSTAASASSAAPAGGSVSTHSSDNITIYMSGSAVGAATLGQKSGGKQVPITGPFILYGSPGVVTKCKASVCQAVEGKGGGRPGKLQGQGSALHNIEAVRAVLQSATAPTPASA